MEENIVYKGKFLQLVVDQSGWESAQRVNVSEAVIIVPVMENGSIILISQVRKPINNLALEFPAGLVGDVREGESELEAARTELFEEAGLVCDNLEYLAAGPTSAGLTNEIALLYLATGCKKEGAGGGDEHEDIEVHEIPAEYAEVFVECAAQEGVAVDPKVYAGFYFLKQRRLLPPPRRMRNCYSRRRPHPRA